MEYTKEMILKLAEDLERCSDPTRRCIGCSFDAACEKENGTAILTAAAAVVRWQMQQLEYQTAVNAHLREMNVVRSIDCARDDRGFGDQDDRSQGQDVEKTMLSCDKAGDAGKKQAWQMGLYERAIGQWGELAQIVKAMEEMDELGAELARALLADEWDDHLLSHIKEELADVCIMTDQLQLIFGDVSDWEMHKLERLERKLERGL